MSIATKQMIRIIESLPDGRLLAHGAQHTVNSADLEGVIPPCFVTGKYHIVFTWSAGFQDWHFEVVTM